MEAGHAGLDGHPAAHLVELVSKTVTEAVPFLLQHTEGDLVLFLSNVLEAAEVRYHLMVGRVVP